ncbi:hypothetical protein DKG77_11820 [Flagellimonas aquimarina]|uniref:Glutaredoxin domain-containing protein n=1 Tax=Flagellimonas aquimarina TaxID=2201895 RepID=A0A316L1Q1_9FLAO|nr:hypothetical protein [Allomuricauda koreensis]PWL38915.1 hypothetical protein DKG77_11820 [Allomuricauda koreensis]
MFRLLFILFCLHFPQLYGQVNPVKVVEKESNNRITFFAENRTFKDYDVLFEVSGKNFRQSAAKPRLIRVPATSKVHLKTIVLFRDKKPVYTKKLIVNDSLSKRAVKKEFEILDVPPPKIKPKKQITIYTTTDCSSCDSIVTKLTAENYLFRNVVLSENQEVKKQVGSFLAKSPEEMDTISSPIISLGGKLYSWIKSYETLQEELNRE